MRNERLQIQSDREEQPKLITNTAGGGGEEGEGEGEGGRRGAGGEAGEGRRGIT